MSTQDNLEELKDLIISDAWGRFVLFCKREAPYADVKIRLVGGEPTELLEVKKKVRFDKEPTIPSEFKLGVVTINNST